jgi:hypothetical protein
LKDLREQDLSFDDSDADRFYKQGQHEITVSLSMTQAGRAGKSTASAIMMPDA